MNDVEFDILAVLLIRELKKKKMRQRRLNARAAIANRIKYNLGFFKVMFMNIKENDTEKFFKYTRMTVEDFDFLLSLIQNELKESNVKAIEPQMCLAITLMYLSQGDTMQSASLTHHLGKERTKLIVVQTCKIIYNTLGSLYLPPISTEDWEKITVGFNSNWNIPNCVGSIDGKHIAITCPANSGSNYLNYKKFYSIVLLAACNSEYKFTMVDVGASGSQGDGEFFHNSGFGHSIINKTLKLPDNKPLPQTSTSFPQYFVGGPAFPLMENLMKPYPGSSLSNDKLVFNYRLSRVRRVLENAFGILAARWRILLRTLQLHPLSAKSVVLATICLHNFLLSRNTSVYCPPNYMDIYLSDGEIIPGKWRDEISSLPSVRRTGPNRITKTAYNLRDVLKDYMNNVGSVPWQNKVLR